MFATRLLLVAMMAWLAPCVASAQSVVTWRDVQTVASGMDVDTTGTPVMGICFASSSVTVRGVTFAANGTTTVTQNGVTASVANQWSIGSQFTWSSPLGGDYQTLLDAPAWSGNSTETLSLSGLTAGQQYIVQFWSYDSRSSTDNQSAVITASASDVNVPTLHYKGAISGQFVIGTFTASATTEVFTLTSPTNSPILNAFQIETAAPAFAAQPEAIVAGGAAALSWPAGNPNEGLTLSPGPGAWTTAGVAPNPAQVYGTSVVVQPAQTTTYTLSGTTAAGTVNRSVTVTVSPPPGRTVLPVIFEFGASPPAVPSGSAVALTWSVYGATSLAVYPGVGSVMDQTALVNGVENGTVTVAPTTTTTYVLAATNSQGTATATATVTATVTIGSQTATYGNLSGADLGINASLNGALQFPADTSSPTSAAAATVINKDISQVPADPMSNEIIAQLIQATGTGAHVHTGFGFNYVVVGNSQPLVPIVYPIPGGAPGPWPVPPDAPVQQECVNLLEGPIFQVNSADHHMTVINRDTGTLYEGYYVYPPAAGSSDHSWTFGAPTYPGGGQVTDLATAMNTQQLVYSVHPVNTGGSYIFPMLLRYDEASSGAIRHALWMNLGTIRQGTTLNPCTAWIGYAPWPANNANFIPNGGHVRLKSSFVIPSGISTETRAILQALKTYGGITIDGNDGSFPPGTDTYTWGIPGVEDTRWSSYLLDAELAAAVDINHDFEVVNMDPSLIIGAITTQWPAGNSTPVFGANGQSQVTVNGVVQTDSNNAIITGMNGQGYFNVAVNLGTGTTPTNSLGFACPGYIIEGGTLAFTGTAAIAADGDAAIYAVIAGSNGLVKTGAGSLTACALNAYTGPTVIAGGTLQLQLAPGLPPASVSIASGAALDISNVGNLTIGALTGDGSATMGNKTLTVGGDNTSCSYAGFLGNNGGGSLVKTGTGKWTLTGTSTLPDPITVAGGILELASTANVSHNAGGWGGVIVNTGGTLLLHGWGYGVDAFQEMYANASAFVVNGGTVEMGAGATSGHRPFSIGAAGATLQSDAGVSWGLGSGFSFTLTNNSSLTLAGAGNGDLSAPIIGTGTLTKNGSGMWTLSNADPFTGATTVNAGKLVISGAVASTSAMTIAAGSTVEVTGQLYATGNIVVRGTLIFNGASPQFGAGGMIVCDGGTIINNSPSLTLPPIYYGGILLQVPVAPSALATTPGNAQVALAWAAVTGAANYNINRSTTSGGPYTRIATAVAGTTYTDASVSNGTTYYYVVSAANAAGEGPNSSETGTMPTGTGALPSTWAMSDVGSPSLTGTSLYNGGGTFAVTGAGGGIAGSSDAFQFAYVTSKSTNFSVIARIQTPPTGSSQVGLMIRSGTAATAKMATVILSPNGGAYQAQFGYRSSTNVVRSAAITGLTVPQWLKLTRAGNLYTGYISSDGSAWTSVGSRSSSSIIASGATAYCGLVVSSNNTGLRAVETFDNVSVVPGWTAPPAEPSGVVATTASQSQINLAWSAVTGATGYQIWRGNSWSGTYTQIGTSVTPGYADSVSLAPGTTYDYMVRATSSSGTSGNSLVAAAMTHSAAPSEFTATAGNAQVALAWSASPGATGYNVKRSTVNGSGYVTIVSNTSATSYLDSAVANWTTYYYVVSAINGGGEGANSTQASAQPQSPPISATEINASSKISVSGSTASLGFAASVVGHTYQLQASDSLVGGTWTDYGPPQAGSGAALVFALPYDHSAPKRFYRLQIRQ